MLGFNTYADAPYGATGGGVAVNAFLTGGAPATSTAGAMSGTGIANITNPSTSATVSVGTVKVNLKKELLGVIASTALNPDVFPDIQEDLIGVSATFSLGTIEVQVTEPMQGAASTGSVGTLELSGKANTTLASTTASMNLGILASAKATFKLSGVSAVYRFNKPTQTAVQKVYTNTDILQSNVVTIRTTIKNKIVYVR